MKKMKLFLLVLVVSFISALNLQAQPSELYDVGSVWDITLVRINANMDEAYFEGLSKTWSASMEQMVKEGLFKSFKILYGESANLDDFNLMLMIEFENFAFMDPDPERDAKMDAVEKKIMDSMGEEYKKTIEGYTNLRKIMGTKTMREIYFKK